MMTGTLGEPQGIGDAVARGNRAALHHAWRLIAVAAALSVGLLAAFLYLRTGVANRTAIADDPITAQSTARTPDTVASDPSAASPSTPTAPPAVPDLPGAPQNVAVAYDDLYKQNTIVVTWTASEGGGPVDHYVVKQGESRLDVEAGSFQHKIPNTGGVHSYVVIAIGSGGEAPSGNLSFPGPPAPPVITSATTTPNGFESSDVSVTWYQPDGAGPTVGYQVLLDDVEVARVDVSTKSAEFAASSGREVVVVALGAEKLSAHSQPTTIESETIGPSVETPASPGESPAVSPEPSDEPSAPG